MNLTALDIPITSAERPGWLERQLVGRQLGELVAELIAFAPPSKGQPSLRQVCGDRLQDLLQSGLKVLKEEQISALIRYPQLLLNLQAAILVNGGEYWDQLINAENPLLQKQVADQWAAISAQLADDDSTHDAIDSPTVQLRQPVQSKNWLGKLGLVAAAIMVGVGIWMSQPQPSGWGFNKTGILTADVSAPEYLESLATAAHAWFNKRPEQKESLKLRLEQFRNGCETLLQAEHPQLADADRDWLLERCAAWKEKIELQLADLESGQKSVMEVREASDEIVRKMEVALRDRAAQTA